LIGLYVHVNKHNVLDKGDELMGVNPLLLPKKKEMN